MKKLSSVLIIMFLVGPYLLPVMVHASGEAWLDGWDYRRELTISGATGAGTDYQVRIDLSYDMVFELDMSNHWTDHAHQGVCTDGVYIYTTSSSDLTKYYKDGTQISTRDTSNDGTFGDYIGDLTYYSGSLYIASHDAGFTDHIVMRYDPDDLSFIEEYDIEEPTITNWDGGFGIDYDNGSFWVSSDSHTNGADFEIQRYNTTFDLVDSWEVNSYYVSGSWHYQGLAWLDSTYIFCPLHENSQQYIDVYVWNGDGFDQYQRLTQPSWEGSGNTNTASQGIDIEEGEAEQINYMWLASRNGVDDESEVGKFVLSGDTEHISLNQHCEIDYSDIRFTDNDGETLLDYWREDVNENCNATFWVKVDDSLETATSIFLYYGNAGVSSLSDAEDTFLFYEDWESESIDPAKWDIQATDGDVSYYEPPAWHGSLQQMTGSPGSNRYFITSDDEWPVSVATRYRALQEKSDPQTADNYEITQIGFEGYGDPNVPRSQIKSSAHPSSTTTSGLCVVDDDGNIDTTGEFDYWDDYFIYDIMRDGDYSYAYANDTLVATTASDPDEEAHNIIIYDRDSLKSTYTDWIFVHKWVDDGPEISVVGSQVYFEWPLPQETIWAINAASIFLGLALMPASTLYLVYGGRENLNDDKVFYVLIMFFVGLALVVGGVMP